MGNEQRLSDLEAKLEVMSTAIAGLQLLSSSMIRLALSSDRAAVERELDRFRSLAEERRVGDPHSLVFAIGVRAIEQALVAMR